MLKKITLTFLIVITTGLLISCGSDQQKTDSKAQEQVSSNEFSLKTISFDAPDPDGNIHSSDEWIGKGPVVINFWGTWCPPCRKEIPDFARLYKEYKDKGIEIIGLALNDSPQKVKDFSRQNNMDWVLLIADRAIAVKYNIRSIPMTFFIDRNGNIVEQYQGLRDYETLKKGFELIL